MYGAITRYGCYFQSIPLSVRLSRTGCSHFARHYFGNLGWFIFLQLLRCFSSPRSLCIPMYSVCNDLKGRVSPFGNLRIKACLLAPRSLSQATTSFIACNRQGIHHVHLFTCPYNVSPLRLNKGAVIEIRSTTLLRLLIHTIITHRATCRWCDQ